VKRNLISLFAGAGGLDLGLEMAGFTTRIANELEPHASETLRRNKAMSAASPEQFGKLIDDAMTQRCYQSLDRREVESLFSRVVQREHSNFLLDAQVIEGDIRTVPSSAFAKILGDEVLFCIAGGPPCQPFSRAGKQKSLDCTKNGDLFFEFVRLVNDLKPQWFIFENVKGLTFTKTDVVYALCEKCTDKFVVPFRIRQDYKVGESCALRCKKCSSETQWHVMNERGGSLKIILSEFRSTGYSCETAVLNAADFGAPQIRERLFIVGNIGGKTIDWPVPTHARALPDASTQGDLFSVRRKTKPWLSVRDALWPTGHPRYGHLKKSSARLWVKNVVRPHDEPVTWVLDRPAPTIGAHQGPKLAIAPHGVPEEQIFRQQWHTEGRRQGHTAPVFVEHCYLSDEELLRLQTFPPWWYLHGTRMERAFQIGNAVPPILGKAVGDAVMAAEIKAVQVECLPARKNPSQQAGTHPNAFERIVHSATNLEV
jgi:DNA (cytosine-5)-methyltransferase 1